RRGIPPEPGEAAPRRETRDVEMFAVRRDGDVAVALEPPGARRDLGNDAQLAGRRIPQPDQDLERLTADPGQRIEVGAVCAGNERGQSRQLGYHGIVDGKDRREESRRRVPSVCPKLAA